MILLLISFSFLFLLTLCWVWLKLRLSVWENSSLNSEAYIELKATWKTCAEWSSKVYYTSNEYWNMVSCCRRRRRFFLFSRLLLLISDVRIATLNGLCVRGVYYVYFMRSSQNAKNTEVLIDRRNVTPSSLKRFFFSLFFFLLASYSSKTINEKVYAHL